MVGAVLGHYRLEAKLRTDHKGVLYRAIDTRLDRVVAIKVLPAPIGNARKRTRLAQDAYVLSQRDHPNIASVYNVEMAWLNNQALEFIVMEYLPGKTLDQLIGRKGLRLREALQLAVQVADGLDAAHSAGIIHGSLNPSSITVTEKREVKIADFGLAGLNEPEEADVNAATESIHLRAELSRITDDVAYMSPEQIEGRSADKRSDIFSFGAVLYEMVAGRRAFPGDSALSTIASALYQDFQPLNDDLRTLEPEVKGIVKRCLRKNPQERWQRIGNVKLVLQDILIELDSPTKVGGAVTPKRGLRLFSGLVLICLALAAGVFIGGRYLTPPEPTFQRLTYRRGDISGARFSPDRTVLFSAQWATEPTRIFSMRPGSSDFRPLDLPNSRILAISSAGEIAVLIGSAGANGAPGTLARVPLSGGAPREVLENVNDADWSPDGDNFAVSETVGGRNRIEYPIGTILVETDGRPPLNLRVSPKGDLLAYFEYDNAVGDYSVTILSLHGEKRVLSRGWTAEGGLAWSPKGDEIWFSGAKTGADPVLRAVSMNGQERTVASEPGWILLKDIARDGRVLATLTDSRVTVLGLVPGAVGERDLSWFEASRVYDISADGGTVLFVEMSYGKPRNTAIYLRKTDGSPAIRLGYGNRPMLSPDGKWVASIVSAGLQTTLTLLPTGAGLARTMGIPGVHYERVEWFPDSQRILFEGSEPNRPARSYIQDVNHGNPVPLTREGIEVGHVSPDQTYATLVQDGRLNLFPINEGKPRFVANLEAGESVIRWSGNGRYLFIRKFDGPASLTIEQLNVGTGQKKLWKEIRAPDSAGVQIRDVVLTPDGKSYAYSFQRDISTLYIAEGLR
jgi:serine/threonine protein kinase/Tol biopolymer transport system component